MKSKRIKWLDFAKGLTIFGVVVSHTFGITQGALSLSFIYYINYILGILIMPVFFAVSGYLYTRVNDKTDYKILIYKKISSFVLPYLIFVLIFNVVNNINHFKNIFSSQFMIMILKNMLIPRGSSYLWFLYALFVIFIIVGTLDLFHIPFVIQIIISVFSLLLECFFIHIYFNRLNSLNVFFTFGYLSCFYMGIIIKRYNLTSYLKKKYIAIILFILWLFIINIQYIFNNNINTDSFTFTDSISKLLSIFCLFSLFVIFNENSHVFNYFTKYGKYTLIIYLSHIPVLSLVLLIIYPFYSSNYLFIFTVPIVWVLDILLVYLSNKLKVVNFIFYPRKYINKQIIKTKFGKKLLKSN